MKKCPFCAEDIQDSAKKCKHCGEFLEGSIVNKEYVSFNYSFILESGRAQFVEFMEKEAGIHDVTYKKNTWTETSGGGSSFFDKHNVSPIQSRTYIEYDVSFKIEKNSLFANKELIDLYHKYYNATYNTGFGGFWGFVVMFGACIAIANQIALVFGDLIPLSSDGQGSMTVILSPIFYYLLRKLILLSRKKTCNDSKSRYKKKIDAFLKK